jgi:hypothetical protein
VRRHVLELAGCLLGLVLIVVLLSIVPPATARAGSRAPSGGISCATCSGTDLVIPGGLQLGTTAHKFGYLWASDSSYGELHTYRPSDGADYGGIQFRNGETTFYGGNGLAIFTDTVDRAFASQLNLGTVYATSIYSGNTATTLHTLKAGSHSLTFDNAGALKVDGATVGGGESLNYSIVDAAGIVGGSTTAGSITTGVRFRPMKSAHVTGCRFYWSGPNTTIKVSLWTNAAGGVRLATVNVSTTGTGAYVGTFSSAISTVAALYQYDAYCTIWDSSATNYQRVTATSLCLPGSTGSNACVNNADNWVSWSPTFQVGGFNYYASGDQLPSSGGTGTNSEYYPIEPTYTVP